MRKVKGQRKKSLVLLVVLMMMLQMLIPAGLIGAVDVAESVVKMDEGLEENGNGDEENDDAENGEEENGDAENGNEENGEEESLYTLGGTVLDINTEEPVEGAGVSLYLLYDDYDDEYDIYGHPEELISLYTTGADGQYLFEELEEGLYYIALTHESYQYEVSDDIFLDQSYDDTVFYLTPVQFSSISGTVTADETGEPIDGVAVYLAEYVYDYEYDDYFIYYRGQTETDADGRYLFTDLSDGKFLLSFSHVQYKDWEGQLDLDNGEDAEFDVSLQPGRYVTGVITDAKTEEAVPNSNVVLFGYDYEEDQWFFEGSDSTNETGEYFINLADDVTWVYIQVNSNNYHSKKIIPFYAKNIDRVIEKNISLTPLGEGLIEVTVTDEDENPIEGANIFITTEKYDYYSDTATDINGQYSGNVPVGIINVYVEKEGYFRESASAEIVEDELVQLNFVLEERGLGSVTGIVTDSKTGELISGVEVSLAGDFYYRIVITDEEGRFDFDDVYGGEVHLSAFKEFYDYKSIEIDISPDEVTTENVTLESLVGHISGKVICAETEGPIDGAILKLVSLGGDGIEVVGTFLTDENGRYEIKNLEPGAYMFQVEKDDFISELVNPFFIGAGDNREIDVALDMIFFGNIYGKVTDSNGIPVEGVRVSTDYIIGYSSFVAFTDEEGNYLLEGIPVGTWNIFFNHDHYYETVVEATVLKDEQTDLDTVMLNSVFGALKGQVTDAEGDPIAGVQVSTGEEKTITDENGEYTLEWIFEGEITVTFRHSEYMMKKNKVILFGGQTKTLNTVMEKRAYGIIGGSVLDAAGAPINEYLEIKATRLADQITFYAWADEDGEYKFVSHEGSPYLLPGDYKVEFFGYGYHDVKRYVSLEKDQTVTIDVTMIESNYTGKVSGTVTNAGGDSLEAILVTIFKIGNVNSNLRQTTWTKQDGTYEFSGLTDGVYGIFFSDFKSYEYELYFRYIKVTGGEEVIDVVLSEQHSEFLSGAITGTVIDSETNEAIPFAEVKLGSYYHWDGFEYSHFTTTNAKGEYSFDYITEGRVIVEVTHGSYSSSNRMTVLKEGESKVLDFRLKTLKLAPVSGVVIDEQNKEEVSGVCVYYIDNTNKRRDTVTGDDGSFTFTDVPVGWVDFYFEHYNHPLLIESVEVVENEVTHINPMLMYYASITGKVIDGESGEYLKGSFVMANSDNGYEYSFDNDLTDENGNYTLSRVAPGSVSILLSVSDYKPETINLELGSGEEITLEDVTLYKMTYGLLEGTVINKITGLPLEYVEVNLYEAGSDSYLYDRILTDSTGYFIFPYVQAGEYELHIWHYDYMYKKIEVEVKSDESTPLEIGLLLYLQPGDVNGDGIINIQDAITLLRYIVGLAELEEDALIAADANGDNKVDVQDAILILQYIVGSIEDFPAKG